MRRIERPSPNQDARSAPVDMLVLHYTGMADAASAIARLCDPAAKVSAHYVVAEDGQVLRLVDEDKRAWHAGRSTWRGRENLNDTSIGIELEGLEDHRFEAAQYETLGSLCSAIALAYPVTGIAGHEHIAPQRKRDPGAAFDWPGLQDALGWPDVFFPPGVTRSRMPADHGPDARPSSSRAP